VKNIVRIRAFLGLKHRISVVEEDCSTFVAKAVSCRLGIEAVTLPRRRDRKKERESQFTSVPFFATPRHLIRPYFLCQRFIDISLSISL
jgi:hypothetical protein